LQKLGRLGRFAGAVGGAAARAHLAASEIEDAGAEAATRVLEQRATARLLDVVAVRGNGQYVERFHHRGLPNCRIAEPPKGKTKAAHEGHKGRTKDLRIVLRETFVTFV
jgi:hypothetical protein